MSKKCCETCKYYARICSEGVCCYMPALASHVRSRDLCENYESNQVSNSDSKHKEKNNNQSSN